VNLRRRQSLTGGREGNGRRAARAEEARRGGEARAEEARRRGSSMRWKLVRRKLDAEGKLEEEAEREGSSRAEIGKLGFKRFGGFEKPGTPKNFYIPQIN